MTKVPLLFFIHLVYVLNDVMYSRYLTMAPSVANFSGIRTFRVLRALRTISVIEGSF